MTEKYIVQNGDTLESIAREFGVSEKDIISANNLDKSYFLFPGQEIVIPITAPEGLTYYEIVEGDTLFSIAGRYNTDPEFLSEINGLEMGEFIYPGEVLLVPDPNYLVYITKEGDTLKFVADAFGVREQELLRYNQEIYLLPDQLIVYKKKQN